MGNCLSATILLAADLLVSCTGGCARLLVDGIDCCTGSGHNTARKKIAWHEQRYANAPVYRDAASDPGFTGELDVDATMKASSFPIGEDRLLELARGVMRSEFGTAEGHDGSCLADDFQFVAPIIGPLSKGEFTRAFGSFKLRDALPDLADNSWYKVDPLEPNRVWFFSRATGTHTGTLNFGRPLAATGRAVKSPPQAQSLLFNEQGQVYTLTVGYAMDKRIGNTEGLGGVFGILKAVGQPLPVPEGQRLYTPSLRYEAVERFGKMAENAGYDPASGKRLN